MIIIIMFQAAKYTPLAFPTVQARSILCSWYFLSTEIGHCFTRAKSCHVTKCTMYSHEKFISNQKGKTTVSFCLNWAPPIWMLRLSGTVKLPTSQTDK